MALSTRQTAAASGTSTGVTVLNNSAFGSNIVAGNLICVAIWYDRATTGSSNTTITVTDNLGNVYTEAAAGVFEATTTKCGMRVFYALVTVAGACTVKATFAGSVTFSKIVAHEVQGWTQKPKIDAAALATQAAPGTATDAISSGSITTAHSGCYVFAATMTNGTFPTLSAGTGYALESTAFIRTEDQVQSAAGTVAGTFTQATNPANQWYTAIMAFADLPPLARLSQAAIEVLDGGGSAQARVSQVATEVLVQHQPVTHVGVSQMAIEVLVPTSLPFDKQIIIVGPIAAPS